MGDAVILMTVFVLGPIFVFIDWNFDAPTSSNDDRNRMIHYGTQRRNLFVGGVKLFLQDENRGFCLGHQCNPIPEDSFFFDFPRPSLNQKAARPPNFFFRFFSRRLCSLRARFETECLR
jgi:hypothetical protein